MRSGGNWSAYGERMGMGGAESKPRDLGNDRGYRVANGSVETAVGMATVGGEGGIGVES